jgi:NodT family efflux transporter outer membrane factor (OMF) lipoprotein
MLAWRVYTIIGLLLFVSSGCTLHHSQMEQAEVKLPGVFVEAGEQKGETSPLGRWWELFGDSSLNELMVEALANNFDVRKAQARLAQFEAMAQSSRSQLFPAINLGGAANRAHSQGLSGESTGTNQSLSVAAAYEVDLWQKLKSTSDAARFTALASRQDLKALYMQLTAQVADHYYLVREKKAQLALLDSMVDTLKDKLQRVKQRYHLGVAAAIDVYQARQNLLDLEQKRPIQQAAYSKASHGLALLLGRFPARDITPDLVEIPAAPAAFPAGLPATLLTNRPDIEAALLRLKAKDKEIGAAVARRFPGVNLLGNYGTARSDLGTVIVSGSFWSIGAELSQSLFDAGKRKAEVSRTEALFAEQLAAYRQVVLNAVREVEDALADNRATEEQLALLVEHEQATAAVLELASGDYFKGLSDYLPVLMAQQAHFKSRSGLLSARRQLLADRISLARALGGTWPDEIMKNRNEL